MSETVELVALFGLGCACQSSLRDTIRRGCVVHHQERDIVGLCCTALEEPERVDDSITIMISALSGAAVCIAVRRRSEPNIAERRGDMRATTCSGQIGSSQPVHASVCNSAVSIVLFERLAPGSATHGRSTLLLKGSRYERSPTVNKRSKSLARQIVRRLKNQSGIVTSITFSSGPCTPGVTRPK